MPGPRSSAIVSIPGPALGGQHANQKFAALGVQKQVGRQFGGDQRNASAPGLFDLGELGHMRRNPPRLANRAAIGNRD
jgi:hypothetical protein